MRSIAVTSLVALAAATYARAGNPTGFEDLRELAVTGALAFGDSVAGDFTGDGRTDVAAIVDGEIVLLFGPDIYRGPSGGALAVPIVAPEGTPELVWDLALFEDVGDERVDALFTTGVNGLVRWRFVDGAWERTWIMGGAEGGQQSQDDTEFAAIATFEYESNGYTWLGVLEQDGVTVRTLLFTRSNGAYFAQLTPRTLATPPITAFALHNLDADVYPEILAVSAAGIDVWSPESGANPVSIATTASAFAVALDEPGPIDRLAYALEYEGDAYLYAVDGAQPETPILFGTPSSVELHALAAGDADGDGWDDVLVSDDDDRFTVFLNRRAGAPTGPTFSNADTWFALDPSAAAQEVPGPVTRVLFADLEDDGDDDVVLWDDPNARGVMLRAATIESAGFAPTIALIEVAQPTGATFPVTIDVSGATLAVPSDATHAEAIAWAVDEVGETLLVAEGVAIVELHGPPFSSQLVLALPVPLDPGDHYWNIEVRFVADAAGAARRAYRSGLSELKVEATFPPPEGKSLSAGVPELRGEYGDLTDLPPFPEEEVPLVPINPPQNP